MGRAVQVVAGAGAALVVLLVIRAVAEDPSASGGFAYHALLSGPGSYPGGAHSEEFDLAAGDYALAFVPSGSSPSSLTVTLEGPGVSFGGEFALAGTPHRTPISEYYTWEYEGDARLSASEGGPARITVDPHGDTGGSVSVMLKRR